jgi:hypothetical protein
MKQIFFFFLFFFANFLEMGTNVFFFFFSFFLCCFKSGDQPQEDLAKPGHKKTIREVENLRILFHVGESLEPIT